MNKDKIGRKNIRYDFFIFGEMGTGHLFQGYEGTGTTTLYGIVMRFVRDGAPGNKWFIFQAFITRLLLDSFLPVSISRAHCH